MDAATRDATRMLRWRVEAGDSAAVDALLEPLHAGRYRRPSGTDRRHRPRGAAGAVARRDIDGEILSEISDAIREEVIDALPRRRAGRCGARS